MRRQMNSPLSESEDKPFEWKAKNENPDPSEYLEEAKRRQE